MLFKQRCNDVEIKRKVSAESYIESVPCEDDAQTVLGVLILIANLSSCNYPGKSPPFHEERKDAK